MNDASTTRDEDSQRTMPGWLEGKPEARYGGGDVLLGRYRILSELGQGGMGVVYKCFDGTAGIEVALKALPPELSHNTDAMEDIRANFQLVSKLVHQNIAVYKQLERDPKTGDYYLIMECVEGENLRSWLRSKRKETPLTLEVALPIIRQIAEALDYAHSEKIIHRDIKPGNVMITAGGKAKVLDFGLAAEIHSSMTRVSMAYHGTSGTGPYMAPEQWRGKRQNAPADQYALAVMTYEMLSGHLPFESTDTAVLKQAVLEEIADPVENISASAQNALKKAMSKDPEERFRSCVAFVDGLDGKTAAPSHKTQQDPTIMVAVLAAACLLGFGGYKSYTSRNPQTTETPSETKSESAGKKPDGYSGSEAEPAGKAKASRQSDSLLQEAYILYAQLKARKEQIEKTALARGQGFGKHLDDLRDHYEGGKTAMDSSEGAAAKHLFEAGLRAADWIETNIPLRTEAQKQLSEIDEEIKPKADKVDASMCAKEDYGAADASRDTARERFEAGSFEEALAALKKAKKGFDSALGQAKGCLLNAARNAAESARWEDVCKLAESVSSVDPDNTDARELKRLAESNLAPSVRFVPMVEGNLVDAVVIMGGEVLKKPFDQKLRKGASYNAAFTYESGGNCYEAKTEFTADWQCVKEVRVTLRKISFNGEVDLSGGLKLEMVCIQAGSFTMGSPDREPDRRSGETQRKVVLTNPYWLGRCEVKQSQWSAVMGNNPSCFRAGDSAERPVEQVSWDDAIEFCNKLNKLYAGRLPEGYAFTLPTEAQWEYACRAGAKTAFSFAEDPGLLFQYGNYRDSSYTGPDSEAKDKDHNDGQGNSPAPVGCYKANAWGLYDMHGNVSEWCLDWYAETNGEEESDPTGPNGGRNRVIRGGSWRERVQDCRSASRDFATPGTKNALIGIRLCLARKS